MPRRPIDILNLTVFLILLTIAVVSALNGRLPRWEPSVLRQVALIVGVLVIVRLDRRANKSKPIELLTNFYPIAVVPLIFDSLQPLITAIGFPNRDAELIQIDRALLGGADAAVALEPLVTPWLSDLMHLVYCTYFFFPIVVGLAMWLRSHELARRFVFTVALAFYVSYSGYFFVPAHGPRYAQWHLYSVDTHSTPISWAIFFGLNKLEATIDDVFPSGHVMVAMVCLLAAYRFDRRLFVAMLPAGIGLTAATIYCRYHYVIDIIAGVALAFATYPAGSAIYDWWARRRRASLTEGRGFSPLPLGGSR